MVESKFYKQKQTPKTKEVGKKVQKYILKLLITAVLTLVLLIAFKLSTDFKQQFNKYVYNTSFPFAKVKEFYQQHFGENFVSKKMNLDKTVFTEKLTYSKKSLYQDGVKLTVSDQYMVPSLESGIVVFIGNKEPYNQTVIIQQMNGVDAWYGNMENISVKLYDYVEKGSLVGEVKGKTLYMAFQKEGKFVDYKNFIN